MTLHVNVQTSSILSLPLELRLLVRILAYAVLVMAI